MEDALEDLLQLKLLKSGLKTVLILVLMEDALEVCIIKLVVFRPRVLILVLMEDALEASKQTNTNCLMLSLNPCFNGRRSRR